MQDKFYYIKKQLDKLQDDARGELQCKVDGTDWDVLEALKNRDASASRRGVFSPLEALEISEIAARKDEFKNVGLQAIRDCKVGAVLLAGGQGTRLGSDRPKGTVNIGLTHDLYIFECLMNNLMKVTRESGAYVPLYIMTSTINDGDTRAFFAEHDYFGYDPAFVKFFVQKMVPAVDYEGRVLMSSEKELVMSPNGNGGWFVSMDNAGLLDDLHEKGVEWLNVFAVDNVLQQIADPVFVGATILNGCDSGSKVVKKVGPEERVGVLCAEDGKPSIIEYYEMTEEMANARKENGDLQYGFGVILNYLFRIDKLEEIMNNELPIHIVEKKIPYMDENGKNITPDKPNGYKFETLILDMIHMMDKCLPYEVEREREFAPIKNLHGVDSVDSARELLQKNGVIL